MEVPYGLGPNASKQWRWLDLIGRWQKSHLPVRAFCRRYALSKLSFYAWRRVLRLRGLIQDPPSDNKTSPDVATLPRPAFVRLTPDCDGALPSYVEVVLSSRPLVPVTPGFDPTTLLQLVRLLEELTC